METTAHKLTVKGHPAEAAFVRAWTAEHADHPDAPAVTNELFVAILRAGADAIEVTLAGAGDRLRVTATGPAPLPLRHSHGPGWRIIEGLSRITGVTADEHGLWAQLDTEAGEPSDAGIAEVFRYCNWCGGYASDVRLVATVDVGSSGQQMSSSACPRHRELHGLTPLVDRPL